MAKKKILGIFDRRPLIWFHYVLLTFIVSVFLGFYVYNTQGIVLSDLIKLDIWFFLWLYLVISIGDQLIHKILKVD